MCVEEFGARDESYSFIFKNAEIYSRVGGSAKEREEPDLRRSVEG